MHRQERIVLVIESGNVFFPPDRGLPVITATAVLILKLFLSIYRCRSKAFVRFDPTVKDHVKFEKSAASGMDNSSRSTEEQNHQQSLPQVSAERYYTTTGSLNIGSSSTGFSLRTLFQQQHPEQEAMDIDHALPDEQQLERNTKSWSASVEGQQPAGDWMKSAGMWHEPLFLQPGDTRFKGAKIIHNKNGP